jgi:integrase
MIKYVFKPKRKVQGRRKVARLYSGRYKLDGEVRLTEVPLKTTDKQVAQKLLDELVREKERERAGIIAPKSLRQSALRAMQEHLADYLSDLRAIGRDDVYIENLDYRLKILIQECGWTHPPKVSADSFTAWRAKQKKAAKTKNQYLESANTMINWMIKNKRMAENPLSIVDKVTLVPAWKRRAFTDDELKRIFDVAGESRIGYLLAVHTGLRRGELKALAWRHINLDGDVPEVFLDGQFTKNGQDAHIPLHPEVAEALRACRPADAKPSDAVLTGEMLPTMWRMKKHLSKAGITYHEDGRRADFHSLGHTLATNLARGNVAPCIAKQILRHSDIRLTMNHYTDASQLPLAEAIGKLPSFGFTGSASNPQRHPQTSDIPCNQESPSGTLSADDESSKVVYPQEFWRNQSPPDTDEENCLARIRT